ncbi:MAG: energy transducer TonB [Bacteroidetes bacterium]|nr:energy transducer TonB [Bacteroidota bacterium]
MLREFIFTESWLDQLFQNKNKMYGAYELRRKNADNTIIAFLWSLAIYAGIGIATFSGYKIYCAFISEPVVIKHDGEIGWREVVLPPKEKPNTTTPEKTPLNKPTPNTNTVPVITDSTDNAATDSSSFSNEKINNGGSGDGTGSDSTDVGDGKESGGSGLRSDPPKPERWVEKMPQFPGGDIALVKWLSNEIKYPEILKEIKKEGIVYLEFVVSETGEVMDVHELRGVRDAPQFTDEAMRAINKMPLWIPGEQNGHKVPVIFTLPINFQLR